MSVPLVSALPFGAVARSTVRTTHVQRGRDGTTPGRAGVAVPQ